jgi:ATP-binding cassette, subfamily B, bacterial
MSAPDDAKPFDVSRMTLGNACAVMIQDLRALLPLIERAAPRALRMIAIAALLEAMVISALPYTTRQLIDSITPARISGVALVPLIWLGIEAALMLGRLIANYAFRHGSRLVELQAGPYLVERVLEKNCNVPYQCMESTDYLDRLSRARQDAPTHAVTYAINFALAARNGLAFLGCLALLIWTAPAWTLLAVALSAAPVFLLDLARARRSFSLEHDNMYRTRQAWYLDWLLSTAEPLKEVRVSGAGRWLLAMHDRIHRPFRDGQKDLSGRHFRRMSVAALFTEVVLYLPYVYVLLLTVRGERTLGEMLFFTLAFYQCTAALNQMLASFANAFEHYLYVHNVLALLDTPEVETQAEPLASNVVEHAPDFSIRDVWFTYPGGNRPVLRGLTLDVRAGETLAIVGRNGIGKTTLVKVLLGLYQADRGSLVLGGNDLSQRPLSWRRDNIGVVLQDFVRYQFAARDAVGAGWTPDAGDEVRLERALQMARADGIVSALPGGLATPLGPAFGGQDLSGGQWQRLALARLFMRRSRLWIMDEPTSAMDPETEMQTFSCFRQWTEGRTAIIITHRFSTARIADRIAVIDDGRVTEIGTHEELMASNGQYAQLFRMQARVFSDSAAEPVPS